MPPQFFGFDLVDAAPVLNRGNRNHPDTPRHAAMLKKRSSGKVQGDRIPLDRSTINRVWQRDKPRPVIAVLAWNIPPAHALERQVARQTDADSHPRGFSRLIRPKLEP